MPDAKLICVITTCIMAGLGCRDAPSPVRGAAKPDYFRVHSVRRQLDAVHSLRLTWQDDAVVYLSGVPAFDLDDFAVDSLFQFEDSDGRACVSINIKPSMQPEFQDWMDRQIGKEITIVVDGEVVDLDILRARPSRSVSICSFQSTVEAKAMCDGIRQADRG